MGTSFRLMGVFLIVFTVLFGSYPGSAQSGASESGAASAPAQATDPSEVGSGLAAAAPAVASGPLPRLVDLGAGKCIPCKRMAPILEEAKKLYEGKAEVVFIDVWQNRDEGGKYGVRMIPTQIFFDASGKEVFRHEGFFPLEDIQKQFESMGIVLENK